MLAAKTRAAAAAANHQFTMRMVEKEYVAIVAGRLEGSGKVDMPLANQTACTKFHVIKHARSLKYGWVTMVKALPETGRKHQIRKHMLSLGHPIIGDKKYTGISCGKPEWTPEPNGLMLWARRLNFLHPEWQTPLDFVAEVPPRFDRFLAREDERWENISETETRHC
uniref:Pseudouridine synthase RsuA/RluA-like domain-containing protein n=2 Tax=Hanusia phi TaxID=3032 RepID=A0A7S0EIB0_9CRYP|mmetsp:Transcript_24216/g.54452  ORF Transcript_24216/g.54452 Transcript_24216/m.54452 type:complete len:167 (+) Transcript_24216:140-640(+)